MHTYILNNCGPWWTFTIVCHDADGTSRTVWESVRRYHYDEACRLAEDFVEMFDTEAFEQMFA